MKRRLLAPVRRLLRLMPVLILAVSVRAEAQIDAPIASVDFYGRYTVPDSTLLHALGFEPGDPVPDSAGASAAVARLKALPRIAQVRLSPVCCDGGTLLYIGIEEEAAEALRFRQAPEGSARLPADVVAAGAEFDRAFRAAVSSGRTGEDDSLGHSLLHDPDARRVQERFTELADRHGVVLREVLRNSADPAQRALAAQVLGYASDKKGVVADLAAATSDPDAGVRNNAMRALALIAGLADRRPELGIEVPHAPFVRLLRSPEWTDRNKASFALVQLTASRDSLLLATLARDAMPELVQIARWRSMGHALPALIVLGRIAGMEDGETFAAAQRGERDSIVRAAKARP